MTKKKLIVIVGPTASGKSSLAVKLAKKFNGEIVSADSRQIYKGMDVGTGKITEKEMRGIPHYLLDVASPKRKFTAIQYRKQAIEAIDNIHSKGKIPILCGGTGFYIQAVVEGIIIPQVKPDWKLRKKLEKISLGELFKKLKKLDPKRSEMIDKNNKRRLVRAMEILLKTKRAIPILKKNPLPYPVLIIGIKADKKMLAKMIEKRFFQWMKNGFLAEVKRLKKSGLSWERIESFGLHYRQAARYLRKVIKKEEMVEQSLIDLRHYSKRQITWFKKVDGIHWVKPYNKSGFEKVIRLSKNFLLE